MLAKEKRFIDRFKARASHAAQVQSRVKKLDKIEKVEPPKRRKSSSSIFARRRARATTWPSSTASTRRYGDARHLRRASIFSFAAASAGA